MLVTTTSDNIVLFRQIKTVSPKNMWNDIEYLAFSGAGTRGMAYLGMAKAFEEHTNFNEARDSFKGFAGTSAGSLAALCTLIRMSVAEMLEVISPIFSSFDNIAPVFDVSLMISNYGLDNGEHLKKAIKLVLNRRGLAENITFNHLKQFFPQDFVCVVTNLSTCNVEYLSAETSPDLQVVDGMFMSMCVPFLFAPMEYNNCLYGDGSLGMDTPRCFEPSKTFCVRMAQPERELRIKNWMEYIHRLFECSTSSQRFQIERYGAKYMMEIDTRHADTIHLHMNHSTVKRLITAGYLCTLTHIFPQLTSTIALVLETLISFQADLANDGLTQ